MVGLGETYLAAFVLAIGHGEMAAGMVSSLPLIAGGLMQLASPMAVGLLRSHKRWVVLCALVQAFTFVPLIVAALTGSLSTSTLFVVASIYWGAGLATGPAWNTWIGTVVPRAVRSRFFANRTRISHACVFAGFLLGGVLLQFLTTRGAELIAFAILFAAAGFCRFVSAAFLLLQSEPTPLPANMRQIPWKQVFHHLRASSGGKLLVYLVFMQAAVQIAGPFFTPFMLKQLGFTYVELVALFSMSFLAKVFSLNLWGRVAKTIGARNLLWIGGISIVPLSGCWLLSQNFFWLSVIQIVGGIGWAAYELAFFLLFFESISEAERTSVLTIYNLLNTAAWVAGAMLGGVMLYAFEASFAGYLMVFGISSAGRLLTIALLARVPRLVVDSDEMGVRTMGVRPQSSLNTPILASLPDQLADE